MEIKKFNLKSIKTDLKDFLREIEDLFKPEKILENQEKLVKMLNNLLVTNKVIYSESKFVAIINKLIRLASIANSSCYSQTFFEEHTDDFEASLLCSVYGELRGPQYNFYYEVFNEEFLQVLSKILKSNCIKTYYQDYEKRDIDYIFKDQVLTDFINSIKFVPLIDKLAGITVGTLLVYATCNPLKQTNIKLTDKQLYPVKCINLVQVPGFANYFTT